MLQLTGNKRPGQALSDLRFGEAGILHVLDLPIEEAQQLMELGFLPGSRVTAARGAPGGNPRVFRVDGSEVAIRVETAARLKLQLDSEL
jgi:Fe2+ transport system protein FeoA